MEEIGVFAELFRQIGTFDLSSCHGKTPVGTSVDTAVKGDAIRMGAWLFATIAVTAECLFVKELRGGFQPFRIVAPTATEGTTFQKNGGSGSGTVVDGKLFNVKNCSFHGAILCIADGAERDPDILCPVRRSKHSNPRSEQPVDGDFQDEPVHLSYVLC